MRWSAFIRVTPAVALVVAIIAGTCVSTASAGPIQLRGLLDLTLTGRGDGFKANCLTRGDSPLDPWGLRVFGEGAISPKFSILTQVVLHDPSSTYVEGAYVMVTPKPERDMHLLVGKIAWPIGTFAPRSYSDHNPLIGKPLLYQHHTTLLWYAFPKSADQLLAVAGEGQSGGSYGGPGSMGMPVVDDSFWDTGAVLTGSVRPVEYAAGLTTGTPGWGNGGEEENRGKTVLGRVGVVPVQGLRIGASGAYGPYLIEPLDPNLPHGKDANDYHQRLGMADAEFVFGHVEVRSEGYVNAWETPNTGDLHVHGGYVEGQLTVIPGVWLAARGEVMRFSTIEDSTGAARTWDRDQDRVELGVGYRIERAARVKAVWQRNVEKSGSSSVKDEHYDVLALQMTVSF